MKVRTYSKGMLQRLGLAQAMINDPDLLFLDEPTDGVDPVGRKEIRDVLRTLKEQGKTIFLNSHLLSEVEAISDRVAILDKGVLVRTRHRERAHRIRGPVRDPDRGAAPRCILDRGQRAGAGHLPDRRGPRREGQLRLPT